MEKATASYDVFINHRGDVKNTVASTIYHWLAHNKGLRVFFDREEFQTGQELLPTITNAISTSSVHIAIFSEHYAESAWCLDELCLMLDSRAPIIAVYYDVEPRELRWIERGAYADAFAQHVQKRRVDLQKIDAWKAALAKISNQYGLELKRFNGDQGKLFKTTVDAVLKALPKLPLDVAEHPVGLEQAVNDFEKFQSKSWQTEQVNVFGIVGMAGSGKTTPAKAFYNRKHSSFSGSSFLFDVNSGRKTLEALQSQLLKDLLGGKFRFDNTSRGQPNLKHRLKSCKSKKFFIVLDGIENADQLTALNVKDVLAGGSLIVITSRNKDLLKYLEILYYEMQPLDPKHAKELFCWNAFGKPYPSPGFDDLVEKSFRKCNGLPWCLKDMAVYLRNEHILEEWSEELDDCFYENPRLVCNLEKDLDKFFQEKSFRVKDAYNDLEEEQRQILLDIACFFVGEDKQLATRIWDPEPNWKGKRCLKILEAKCLIQLDSGRLTMHYPFQVLGKYIAKKTSPYRICGLNHDNDFVDQWKKGMEIRGIVAATGNRHDSQSFFRALFQKMQLLGDHFDHSNEINGPSVGLKLLVTKGDCFESELGKLSRDLAWLRWYDCPHRTISPWLPMANLRVLEIEGHHIQNLWQDEAPSQLRELRIRCGRHSLEEIAQSIGSLTYLEKIVLDCGECICTHHTLPDAFCSIRSLRHLEFHCRGLTSLPKDFQNLRHLEHVDCSGCSELKGIPSSFRYLPRLKYLNLERCNNLSIQFDILESLRAREQLIFIFEGCRQVLPMEMV